MAIYFDHNATTPLCDVAKRTIHSLLDGPLGNPSSVHTFGRRARDIVETARRQTADLLRCDPAEIVFTSGGSEANLLGVVGLAQTAVGRGQSKTVVTSGLEHPAVLSGVATLQKLGFDVVFAKVGDNGHIDLGWLAGVCKEKRPSVVTVNMANHETGIVADMQAIYAVAHKTGALVHADGVQYVGKVGVQTLPDYCDAMAVSAHKLYGPKGVGALWVNRQNDIVWPFGEAHHERGRRGGTENVLGIAAAGAAAEYSLSRQQDWEKVKDLRCYFESRLLASIDCRIHGHHASRLANTTSVHCKGVMAEVIVTALDIQGIYCSTGAACTSGSTEPSAILLAMGIPEEVAKQSLRFSFGLGNTQSEVDTVLDRLPSIVERALRHG